MAVRKKAGSLEDRIERLIDELEEARCVAQEASAPTPMISATLGKAKLLSLLFDKNKDDDVEIKPVLVRFVASPNGDDDC